MSLAGNLEDLGLGEILQIVSLSRKTGVLSLTSGGRNGSVFFRKGQVVRATSSAYRQSLGVVLIQKGVIDPVVLRKALAIQQEQGFSDRLGVILVKNFSISQETVEEVVREQIENVVFSLFNWGDGDFKFEVQDNIDTVDGPELDPLQFMLDQGLNPQFLAMEGTRKLDEKRNADQAGFGAEDYYDDNFDIDFDLVDADAEISPVPPVQQSVVVVDDDGPTLMAIAESLTERGLIVHAMTRSEETLLKVDTLHRGGDCPVILIDLIMPKMDGSGVLGGIELLELLHNNFNMLRIIVMSDYHHVEAEKAVFEMDCHFIIKPRRVEIGNPGILQNFISQLCDDIRNTAGAIPSNRQNSYNLGDELRIEMGEDDEVSAASDSQVQNGGLSLLRGMLEELNNPDLQGGVLLLVLRFASEFFNRAIVFTINDNIISGSGQFGISGGKISGDERIRAINIPLEAGSIFKDSLKTGRTVTFKPDMTSIDKHFFEQLGGWYPNEVFIGPILSRSRIIGFLYGDNQPDKSKIGDTETLAIFLSQAGIAMEKSLIERQLHERATV